MVSNVFVADQAAEAYNNYLEHVYMRPEVNSNRFEISNHFEMSFRLHGNLHEISLQQLSKQ